MWRLQEPLPRRRKQEVATACGRRRQAHALVLLAEEEGDRGRLLGWPASWAGFSPGPGKPGEVFPFCFFFLFSVICFDLVIILNLLSNLAGN